VQLLEQFVGQLHVPAQLWDADGTVLLTNVHFNELFGLPPHFDWAKAELCLASDRQVLEAGAGEMLQRALDGMATEIHSLNYDPAQNPKLPRNQGETLQLFLSLQPLFADDGEVVAVVCLVLDFAAGPARIERQLMRSQKMENVETLASGVAHEFNNIFTGIKGMTDLIKYEVDSGSEIHEFADTIEQNIARGADLIQKLSSFAREVPYSLRRLLLSDYLLQALPLLQLQVQRRVQIETKLKANGVVLLDPSRMDQALANVMLNARDATGGQGAIQLVVDRVAPEPMDGLDLPAGQEWIMLEVADSGPGIPVELRERVLEPFFSTKERGKATGLGLSVTDRIVRSHNGLVQIGEAVELGGAAIRLFLPLVTVAPAPDEPAS
jgi:signal transduction histidine kinase